MGDKIEDMIGSREILELIEFELKISQNIIRKIVEWKHEKHTMYIKIARKTHQYSVNENNSYSDQ